MAITRVVLAHRGRFVCLCFGEMLSDVLIYTKCSRFCSTDISVDTHAALAARDPLFTRVLNQ